MARLGGRPGGHKRIVVSPKLSDIPAEPNPIPTAEASPELRAQRIATAVLLQGNAVDDQMVTDLFPEESKAMGYGERKRLAYKLSEEERAKEILRNNIGDLEAARPKIIAHQIEIALNRDNPEAATRSAALLAKIGGWEAPTKVDVSSKNITIHSLMSNPQAIQDALALMSHEPGPAVAIQSDARDDYERRHGKAPEGDDE